jgi:hypothetical protein
MMFASFSEKRADYDGTGGADVGVWRPSDGNWYLILGFWGETMTVRAEVLCNRSRQLPTQSRLTRAT